MRQQQQVGKHGQQQAASYLSGLGLEMVEPIGTPVTLLPFGGRKDVFRIIFGERVSGDHRALLSDGTSVLIETKTVYDGNLTYSHLREHQPERLSRHAGIGNALSLLVWVHHSGIYVMRWGRDGIDSFGYRKSITPERAAKLHQECLAYLEARMVSVKHDANSICTDAIHVGPFIRTTEGHTKCDACGEKW
jgi:hypothetical protein